MATEADAYFNQPRGIALLWVGVLAGPIAWFLHQQISYLVAYFACPGTGELVLHLVTAVMLLTVVAGALIAWFSWSRVGREWTARGGDTVARSRFMAVSGLLCSGLFFLIIVAQWIPTFFLSPCP